jgi:hypothetical protein
MGVIGIGFDTEGSMMNPSTACGVYGKIIYAKIFMIFIVNI